MADLTKGAVDGLLGLLATAIGDEARLLGGLPGNMQFIKDEMDSMNGFLAHLTKTESEHDDQIRAWMKQVREIAYIAEDIVERYVRDIVPHQGVGRCKGCLGQLAAMAHLDAIAFLIRHPKKYCLRRQLAMQLLELRVRVNDVGERRHRYGVEVPSGSNVKKAEDGATAAQEEKENFLGALELMEQGSFADSSRPTPQEATSFITKATGLLPNHVRSQIQVVVRHSDAEATGLLSNQVQDGPQKDQVRDVPLLLWEKCSSSDEAFRCIKMLLCALYVYPYKGKDSLELDRLKKKLEQGGGADEIKKQAMVFCYSLLSTNQKSCLQYLTCFLEETAISRTSLVRRWVAEGLVGKEQGKTLEDAGELYFKELLFRGFISPHRVSDAGTVKSCKPLSGSIKEFIASISRTENFVVDLPVYLDHQIKIRKIVKQQPRPQHPAHQACWGRRCCRKDDSDDDDGDPMKKLENLLRGLPALFRLNVLDLGGCKGLKRSHIGTICTTVDCLKYLCLRKTDVPRLPWHDMEKLKLLETLDIRETRIRPGDVKRMCLKSMKHLLAGRYIDKLTGEDAPTTRTAADLWVDTVEIPERIGAMKNMQTLSHVQVSGELLREVARLHQLKKLGVVIHQATDRAAEQLLAVISRLAGSLRSLSIWITAGVLDVSVLMQEPTSSLVLENLDINGRISSSLPSWVQMAGKLANISLRDTEMNVGETLRRLANIQKLRCLRLRRRSFIEQALVFRDVSFTALKFLVIDGDTITSVTFAADAVPELEKIFWAISKVPGGELTISGIQNLKKLKEIEIRANFNVNNLLQSIAGSRTDPPPATGYRCRYVGLSDFKDITEVKKANTDDISLSAGDLNQQQ
ncbi:unnamed protein product [Urochloa humidicola]